MKRVLILIFFIEVLMGVDLLLDDKSNESTSKQELQDGKIYFGKRLFQGGFKDNKQLKYSPNYLINIDDTVSIKLWGAYEYGADLKVDSRGNIFIPKVGTVHLLGVNSQELKEVVSRRVRAVFNNSVSVYANLNSYQPISIFVTGGVKKPGLYEGFSSDSVLQLIDKAGGIVDGQGSYRAVAVLRDNKVVKRFDLYRFLLDGKLGLFQFRNGDVVKVDSLKNRIEVTGEVRRPYIFELNADSTTVNEVMQFVLPKANVTHFMITHWSNGFEKVDKYPIDDRYRVFIKNGEKIHFISDYLKENLSIEIDGEHANLHTMTIQKGTTLKELLSNIIMTPLSDASAVQLYRKSIALRQKQLISANLRDLEARVLTTGSSTTEEAKIRKEESAMVLNFIDRASKIEPKGQVIINKTTDLSQVVLEDGDRVFIPKKSQVVVVEGEVSLPNAQTFVSDYKVEDYIESCGGYSPRANEEKVLLVKKNGRVITYNASSWWGEHAFTVEAGDSILVLGKVDSKNIQITSSVTQILYQIAVGAAVVLRAF
ncbi:Capsular polysaccharide export system periplasmic protein KpsD [hydrothermal vent metagenome]|uniref:Capsular polysaccharide export system periplasmic protein KpsD n=1 Tax=hydrothermal vent metagenome TaxID=652676 RepID=A0A1W1BY36_9ZZZZ